MKGLLTTALLVLCVPTAEQHTTRTNRVWTLSVKTNTCDLLLVHAMSGIWDYENGKIINSIQASTGLTMFQWSVDFPLDVNGRLNTNYRAADFIEEMGQTIYTYDVYVLTKSDQLLRYSFWVSPLGLSNKKIPPAPLRQFVNGDFDADDQQMLTRWFLLNHKWSNKNIWKDFDNISHKFDPNGLVEIHIKDPNCAEKSIASHSGHVVREAG